VRWFALWRAISAAKVFLPLGQLVVGISMGVLLGAMLVHMGGREAAYHLLEFICIAAFGAAFGAASSILVGLLRSSTSAR
jgi:hypothetical protein